MMKVQILSEAHTSEDPVRPKRDDFEKPQTRGKIANIILIVFVQQSLQLASSTAT